MDKCCNSRNTINNIYSFVWVSICIISLQSCGFKVEKIENTPKEEIKQELDSLIQESSVLSIQEVEPLTLNINSDSLVLTIEEPETIDSTSIFEQRIQDICDALNEKLETEFNYSNEINEILTYNKVPLRSAYCGATVNYILHKAGIPYNVKNPEWASNNFIDKSEIVWQKGKWLTSDRTLKKGFITGYKFSSERINHVGLFNNEDNDYFKAFEGNTNDPTGKRQQGFYYRDRKKIITYIRRTY